MSYKKMIIICELELALLEMALNPKKSVCIRFGPRFDAKCAPLVSSSGQQLEWVKTCRYLACFLLLTEISSAFSITPKRPITDLSIQSLAKLGVMHQRK